MANNDNRLFDFIRRRRIRELVIAFLVNVLLFSVAYWLIWQFNPEAFIVNQELNLTPISDLKTVWELYFPDEKFSIEDSSSFSDGLDSLNLTSRELIAEMEQTAQEIEQLENQLLEISNEFDIVYEDFSMSMDENFDDYFNSSLQPFRIQQGKLRSRIEAIEKTIETSEIDDDVSEMKLLLSQLNKEQAELNVETLRLETELLRTYLDEREKFYDQEDFVRLNDVTQRQDAVEDRIFELKNSVFTMRGDIYNTWVEMYNTRIDRLGILDFIYFSFTVSAANVFGDILPNNTFTRMLVLVQLFINLVIVGTMVTLVVDHLKGPSDTETRKS